jgi:hypothetical protein
MSKFLQATNLTWSDSTATSVFQNCPVIHCENVNLLIRYRNKSVINKNIVNNNIISKRIMNKSIINRSMIIKSNTIFFIYTIVIIDSKVFINKTESLRYLELFSLAPLSSLRGRRAHSLPFWWSSISTVSWC